MKMTNILYNINLKYKKTIIHSTHINRYLYIYIQENKISWQKSKPNQIILLRMRKKKKKRICYL